jgi:4-hydroxybutyryl-CoA dehydratase/vinylacetyl-CoA-Delta-isomerase
MGLKTPAEYVESLRDGRVTYWDGERIDDITTHRKFQTPIAVACGDYDYANPARRERITYRAEDAPTIWPR